MRRFQAGLMSNKLPCITGKDQQRSQTQGMRSNAQRYMDDYGIRTGLIGWYEIIQVGIVNQAP